MSVVIPTFALHRETDIWPHVDNFHLDRFLPETKTELHDPRWLLFGLGPGKCLGKRLGLLIVKEPLVVLLQRYRLVLALDTEIPVKLEKGIHFHPETKLFMETRDQ